jgi:hypothetical protein
MSVYYITVVSTDGSVLDVHENIVEFREACRMIFRISDALSAPTLPGAVDVEWVNLYEGDRLELSVQIIPGVPLAGAERRQFPSTSRP